MNKQHVILMSALLFGCGMCGMADNSGNVAPATSVAPVKLQTELETVSAALARANTRVGRLLSNRGAGGTGVVPSAPLRGPNKEKLGKIVFPADPAADNLRRYIGEILMASAGQNVSNEQDPQVAMLKRVGAARVELLFEALDAYVDGDVYLIAAINALAGPANKDLTVRYFADYPELIDVISRNGWSRDVRNYLLAGLYSPIRCPMSWAQAVIALKDAADYPALLYYLCRTNRYSYYQAYLYLEAKGMPLNADAVQLLWQNIAASGDPGDKVGFAAVAVGFGEKGALAELIRCALEKRDPAVQLAAIYHYTSYRGTPKEISAQFEKEKEQLYFDQLDKKFKVKAVK